MTQSKMLYHHNDDFVDNVWNVIKSMYSKSDGSKAFKKNKGLLREFMKHIDYEKDDLIRCEYKF